MIKTLPTESETFRRPLPTGDLAMHLCSFIGPRLGAIGRQRMSRSLKRIEQPLPSPDMSYRRLSRDVMRIEARRLLQGRPPRLRASGQPRCRDWCETHLGLAARSACICANRASHWAISA